MSKRWIPYARQSITTTDVDEVVRILRSPNLTQGPSVAEFESQVARACGAKYAVAVNSATSALHIACLAAGLGPGDRHWTSPNTFVASANCGLYCGSTPDFVDIDPQSYNMSVAALKEKLSVAAGNGTLPKVLIPVHFSGKSAEMKEIRLLAEAHGITVIEDASHAIGGTYLGRPVGSCEFSDMVVFSFHPVKIITSGEGGMIVTNDEGLHQKLLRLRSHGITREERFLTKEMDGPWSYEQLELGYNYRLTDLQAILGMSQMKRIADFVERRQELVDRYDQGLKGLPLQLPSQDSNSNPAWHLYVVRVKPESPLDRRGLFVELKERGIGTNVHYIPVHTQPFYRSLGFADGQFPVAEAYYSDCLSLPLYYELSDEEQDHVISTIRSLLKT